MQYDLTRMGPGQFERLITMILTRILGSPPSGFETDTDNERVARYRQSVVWPSDLGYGSWSGRTFIFAPFLQRILASQTPNDWLKGHITAILRTRQKQWADEGHRTAPRENLVIASNALLTVSEAALATES